MIRTKLNLNGNKVKVKQNLNLIKYNELLNACFYLKFYGLSLTNVTTLNHSRQETQHRL